MKYRPDPGTLAGLLVILALAIAVFLLVMGLRAHASWQEVAAEWDQYRLNESQREWFRSIKAPSGVPCCDIADGHPTEMERCLGGNSESGKMGRCGTEDGIYIPDPIHLDEPRAWIKVPDTAVVKGATNPVGVATVWWTRQSDDTVYVRCFVPEAES